ncbi:glycosyltransferase [uncultured Faecalicoccus sp.]|uniref:glycosyltransferase family 2 protein n=1 Tax=uncultured Faecalicoccus sp. TaxID=1971760 RepID=UPI0025839647|nr:glycosyltransferase [uncultured Faecalicoccus sp.]
MRKDRISIIVPVYNVEKYIKRCLDSLTNQTYPDLEIIVVDDGSTDGSGRICDEYAKKDNRINVIHKANGGLSSARNAGLKCVQGEFVGFVDSDDYIELNMYECMLKSLKMTNSDIACAGIYRESLETGKKTVIRCSAKQLVYSDKEAIKEILLSRSIGISVWSKLYKSKIFTEVEFPIGETNEDAKILLETMVGRKVVHTGLPLYHYIVRDNSITSSYNKKTTKYAINNAIEIRSKLLKIYPDMREISNLFVGESIGNLMVVYHKQKKIVDDNYSRYWNLYKENWIYTLRSCNSLKRIMVHLAIRTRIIR